MRLPLDIVGVLIQKDQLLLKLGQRTPIDSRDSRPLDLFKIGSNWDWICSGCSIRGWILNHLLYTPTHNRADDGYETPAFASTFCLYAHNYLCLLYFRALHLDFLFGPNLHLNLLLVMHNSRAETY